MVVGWREKWRTQALVVHNMPISDEIFLESKRASTGYRRDAASFGEAASRLKILLIGPFLRSAFNAAHRNAPDEGAAGKQENQKHGDCDYRGSGEAAPVIGVELGLVLHH